MCNLHFLFLPKVYCTISPQSLSLSLFLSLNLSLTFFLLISLSSSRTLILKLISSRRSSVKLNQVAIHKHNLTKNSHSLLQFIPLSLPLLPLPLWHD